MRVLLARVRMDKMDKTNNFPKPRAQLISRQAAKPLSFNLFLLAKGSQPHADAPLNFKL